MIAGIDLEGLREALRKFGADHQQRMSAGIAAAAAALAGGRTPHVDDPQPEE